MKNSKKQSTRGMVMGVAMMLLIGVGIVIAFSQQTFKVIQQSNESKRHQSNEDVVTHASKILAALARDNKFSPGTAVAFEASTQCLSRDGYWWDGNGDFLNPTTDVCATEDNRYRPGTGGVVPENYGGPLYDEYGRRLGYYAFAWQDGTEDGEISGDVSYFTPKVGTGSDQKVLAVVSAGADGVFQTKYTPATAGGGFGKAGLPTPAAVTRGGDDVMVTITSGILYSTDLTNNGESLPSCDVGYGLNWDGEQFTCLPLAIDLNGDGTISASEDALVDKMINCAKCGKLTCDPADPADPKLYNATTDACVAVE